MLPCRGASFSLPTSQQSFSSHRPLPIGAQQACGRISRHSEWSKCAASGPAGPSRTQEDAATENSAALTARQSPNPDRLRLQKVEKLGEDVWAGVAAVDRGNKESDTSLGRAALLVGGDLAAILIFVAIGRSGHGESLDPGAVLKTAAPFLIGWFGAADLQKAFSAEAQGGRVGPAAKKAAIVWATGIPVGISVRTAQRGYLPDISFVLVTLVTTLVFLVGWRSALAAITPVQDEKGSKILRRRDKQGNPFEFLQLLASLTKRW